MLKNELTLFKWIQLKSATDNLWKSIQESQKFVADIDKNVTEIKTEE